MPRNIPDNLVPVIGGLLILGLVLFARAMAKRKKGGADANSRSSGGLGEGMVDSPGSHRIMLYAGLMFACTLMGIVLKGIISLFME